MRDELREAFNRLSAFLHPSSLIPHPFSSTLIPHPLSLLFILALVGASFIIACLVVVVALSRHQKSGSRPLRLEGRMAQVVQALEPEGSVLVGGELWRARARNGERIARGKVRIVGARSHWLEVEEVA